MATAQSPAELARMLTERVAGVPLEHVLGWTEFCGLRIAVAPGVFVPRRRTELLVLEAVAVAPPAAVVVDLCCGSGAVGAAIASTVGGVKLYGVDIDPAAVDCARRNFAASRGQSFTGDLFEPLPATLRGHVDVLAVNAPYVPTDAIALMPAEARLHEPLVALDGGLDGLDVVRRVAADAATWLAPRGHLLVEASERQLPLAVDIVAAGGLTTRTASSDELGTTVVIGIR